MRDCISIMSNDQLQYFKRLCSVTKFSRSKMMKIRSMRYEYVWTWNFMTCEHWTTIENWNISNVDDFYASSNSQSRRSTSIVVMLLVVVVSSIVFFLFLFWSLDRKVFSQCSHVIKFHVQTYSYLIKRIFIILNLENFVTLQSRLKYWDRSLLMIEIQSRIIWC